MPSANSDGFVKLLKNKQSDKKSHPLHREAKSPEIYAAPPIDPKAEQLRLERIAQLQFTNEDIEALKSGMKTSFAICGTDRIISRWELLTLPAGMVNAIYHEASSERKVYQNQVDEINKQIEQAKKDGDDEKVTNLFKLRRIVDDQRRMYIRYSYTAEAIATCNKAAREQLKEETKNYFDALQQKDKYIEKLKDKLEKLQPKLKISPPIQKSTEPRSVKELSKMADELTLEVASQYWSAAELASYSECIKNERDFLEDQNTEFSYEQFELEKMLRENALEDLLCLEAQLQEAREQNRRYREGIN